MHHSSRLTLVLVALALLAAGAWWLLRGGAAPPPSVEPAAAAERAPAAEPAAEALAPAEERVPLAASQEPEPSARAPEAPPAEPERPALRARGSVLGLSGEPLGGVPLSLVRAPDEVLARSRPDGGFELEVAPLAGSSAGACLHVPDRRWCVVRTSCVSGSERALLVVLAPAIDVAGRTLDERGQALGGVQVQVAAGADLMSGFTQVLDDARAPGLPRAESGADGRFALEGVPAGVRFALVARAPGRGSARVAMPDAPRDDLELVLPAEAPAGDWTVDGVVLQRDGRVAAGAQVRLGDRRTTADADGRFRLACRGARVEEPLVAWAPDLQPAVLERFGERLAATEGRPGLVELVLGPPALALSGRVVDAEGAPEAGWLVDLIDGTPLSVLRMPPELVESAVAGERLPVTTSAAGRFTIRGLSPRRYVVRAFEPASLIELRSEPVEAGRDDLVLRVPADAMRAGLSGTVTSRSGVPLAGVDVMPQLVLHEADWGSSWTSGRGVTTDENGRFALGELPRRVVVAVGGSDVIPEAFTIEAREPDDGHVLRVAARCHFKVEPGDGPPFEWLSAEDADGSALQIYAFEGGGWSSFSSAPLSAGASRPLAVSEDARTLVFSRAGAPERRVPVALAPGELVTVRP